MASPSIPHFDHFRVIVNLPVEYSNASLGCVIRTCKMFHDLSIHKPLFNFSVVVGLNSSTHSESSLREGATAISERIALLQGRIWTPPAITSFSWEPCDNARGVNFSEIRNRLLASEQTTAAFEEAISSARRSNQRTCVKLMSLDSDTMISVAHLQTLEDHWQENEAFITPCVYDYSYPEHYVNPRHGMLTLGVETAHHFDKRTKLQLARQRVETQLKYMPLAKFPIHVLGQYDTLEQIAEENKFVLKSLPQREEILSLCEAYEDLLQEIRFLETTRNRKRTIQKIDSFLKDIHYLESDMPMATSPIIIPVKDILYPAEPVFAATIFEKTLIGEINFWPLIRTSRGTASLWGVHGGSEGQSFCLKFSDLLNASDIEIGNRMIVAYPDGATCLTTIPNRCLEPPSLPRRNVSLDDLCNAFTLDQSQSSLSRFFPIQRTCYLERLVDWVPRSVKLKVTRTFQTSIERFCRGPREEAVTLLRMRFIAYKADYLDHRRTPPSRRYVMSILDSKGLTRVSGLSQIVVDFLPALPP